MHIILTKWTIFLTAMVLYFAAYRRNTGWLRWTMLIIAVLYNPLINISMDPYGRQIANLVSFAAFLAAMFWVLGDKES